MDLNNFGFIKVAVASPILKVGNPEYNSSEISSLIKQADKKNAAIVVFPELSLTGYTCGDLFNQKHLLNKSIDCLMTLISDTASTNIISIIGVPLLINDALYNCGIVFKSGNILGIVPKMFIPNYKEFYEKRWFTSGIEISKHINDIHFLGKKIPFGNLIFDCIDHNLRFGVEICEDLWTAIPPSSFMVLRGTNVILNLSASNELVSKADYRRELISQQSARGMCAYLYASAGVHESTTDLVFSGDSCIFENGAELARSERFVRESQLVFSDIDLDRLTAERQLNKSFADSMEFALNLPSYRIVEITSSENFNLFRSDNFDRIIDKSPFVPNNPLTKNERCNEIFHIQVTGLAKRIEHTKLQKAVIGISGGLDSTLALLVIKKTFDLLNLPSENIIAITMPGFGTTDKTYDNAMELMRALHVTIKEINIVDASLQHFKDLGHDAAIHDITYENTQARERTQILMNYANKIGGLVIGTGDLSELALGWCTYNGDHMSMYGVNGSIPKTLVQHMIRWYRDYEDNSDVKTTLQAILDTPISPELLPPDKNGDIKQMTEDVIGPYELHDFFLYHFLRFGAEPLKIFFLANIAFKATYSPEEIKKWLLMFLKRFFTQQFKRSCLPDGPKVGSVSLSPRGDWRMPSDADGSIWIKQIEML